MVSAWSPHIYVDWAGANIFTEFAHGKVDPHEAGKKGGQAS